MTEQLSSGLLEINLSLSSKLGANKCAVADLYYETRSVPYLFERA